MCRRVVRVDKVRTPSFPALVLIWSSLANSCVSILFRDLEGDWRPKDGFFRTVEDGASEVASYVSSAASNVAGEAMQFKAPRDDVGVNIGGLSPYIPFERVPVYDVACLEIMHKNPLHRCPPDRRAVRQMTTTVGVFAPRAPVLPEAEVESATPSDSQSAADSTTELAQSTSSYMVVAPSLAPSSMTTSAPVADQSVLTTPPTARSLSSDSSGSPVEVESAEAAPGDAASAQVTTSGIAEATVASAPAAAPPPQALSSTTTTEASESPVTTAAEAAPLAEDQQASPPTAAEAVETSPTLASTTTTTAGAGPTPDGETSAEVASRASPTGIGGTTSPPASASATAKSSAGSRRRLSLTTTTAPVGTGVVADVVDGVTHGMYEARSAVAKPALDVIHVVEDVLEDAEAAEEAAKKRLKDAATREHVRDGEKDFEEVQEAPEGGEPAEAPQDEFLAPSDEKGSAAPTESVDGADDAAAPAAAPAPAEPATAKLEEEAPAAAKSAEPSATAWPTRAPPHLDDDKYVPDRREPQKDGIVEYENPDLEAARKRAEEAERRAREHREWLESIR